MSQAFLPRYWTALLLLLVLPGLPILAATFTSDTTIYVTNATYDGADIVVSNATLTIDGPHTFASLSVLKGGVLTHSQSSVGVLQIPQYIVGEALVLNGTNFVTLSHSNVIGLAIFGQGQSGPITYTNTLDYVFLQNGALTEIRRTSYSTIGDGDTVLVDYITQIPVPSGLNLTIISGVVVAAGGAIDVDGRGYSGGFGPGTGRSSRTSPMDGSGAGYGGYGGMSSSNAFGGGTYDDVLQPSDKGSGGGAGTGGNGSIGGGAVKLSAGGTIQIDGIISANGFDATNTRSGGGAGGSVLLSAPFLTGTGSITAGGGAGEPFHGGGGGGGRIALYFGSNTYSGNLAAVGGAGFVTGGAGTICTRNTNELASLIVVDNGGRSGTNTTLGTVPLNTIDLTLTRGGILNVAAQGLPPVGTLLITSNSFLMISNTTAEFPLTILSNAVIQAGGGVVADGAGFVALQGPGAGRISTVATNGGGGAGYGGIGGDGGGGTRGGNAYGSLDGPVDRGSGGGNAAGTPAGSTGGSGGGAVRVNVSGNLQLDGRISANGFSGNGTNTGGGAGGSLWISVGKTFSGAGQIMANGGGGTAPNGGGGGGGRIALSYGASTYTGTLSAHGGAGFIRGGAGTVFLPANEQQFSQVVVDNGGLPGAPTTLGTSAPSAIDVILTGRGTLTANGSLQVEDLSIAAGSSIVITNRGTMMEVFGNATIAAEGAISGSASAGSVSQSGQGIGGSSGVLTPSGVGSGGGGYGGFGNGGLPVTTLVPFAGPGAAGGVSFGGALQPTNQGGNGGAIATMQFFGGGGLGGLPVRLTVDGTLLLNGRISSDGAPANAQNAGGGGGGAVWLTVGTLAGSGAISANGGAGMGLGGSGGGGRIALYYATNNFAGPITAQGGGGGNFGGAGTIYTRANDQAVGQILVDNGGNLGTNSLITDTSSFDLVVQNDGAVVPPPSGMRNVLVASNGFIFPSNQSLTISGNVTVQAGGTIRADGWGFRADQGPGAGATGNVSGLGRTGGGGGLGGIGGAGAGGASGGAADARAQLQVQTGSGGGGNLSPFLGGSGGGVVNLYLPDASQTLVVNGTVTADGNPADTANSGGGSGGFIALNVGTLSGSGLLSADGGAGNGAGGGGGAGGRIVVIARTNQFNGTSRAYGAPGGIGAGGAGTIVLVTPPGTMPVHADQLIVDNGGLPGAGTPVSSHFELGGYAPLLSPAFELTVTGGAVAFPTDPYLAVSNLFVGNAGVLTGATAGSNLNLLVYGNVEVGLGAAIAQNGLGGMLMHGPGAGATSGADGSGGGYGGEGGVSASGVPGGATYGSLTMPIDPGSGGGPGSGQFIGGSDGGGVLRIDVGGTFNVDGTVSANGNPGVQDNSGGGSGGSIWITTGTLTGGGNVTADGGEGELYGGGGGGGGRIAIYQQPGGHPANAFTGLISAFGANGDSLAGDGSVFMADAGPLTVLSQNPSGVVSNFVSALDFQFNAAVKASTLSGGNLTLVAPNGVTQSLVNVTMLAPALFRFSFPQQTATGTYSFTLAPTVQNLYGQAMTQPYSGTFTLALPTISGTVFDSNGLPFPGIEIQPSSDLVAGAVTDTNGNYALSVVPTASFTGTPMHPNYALSFAPMNRTYTNVTTSFSNQNYVAYSSIAAAVSSGLRDTNLMVNWLGITGVTYQIYASSNLVDWVPYGDPISGSNATVQVPLPANAGPRQFFRVQANQ